MNGTLHVLQVWTYCVWAVGAVRQRRFTQQHARTAIWNQDHFLSSSHLSLKTHWRALWSQKIGISAIQTFTHNPKMWGWMEGLHTQPSAFFVFFRIIKKKKSNEFGVTMNIFKVQDGFNRTQQNKTHSMNGISHIEHIWRSWIENMTKRHHS